MSVDILCNAVQALSTEYVIIKVGTFSLPVNHQDNGNYATESFFAPNTAGAAVAGTHYWRTSEPVA